MSITWCLVPGKFGVTSFLQRVETGIKANYYSKKPWGEMLLYEYLVVWVSFVGVGLDVMIK